MDAANHDEPPARPAEHSPSISCTACDAALQSPSRESVSFLLLDQFTVPLVGCAAHLDQFSTICGLTTEDSATVLEHHPAGGLHCPSCRRAGTHPQHPILPVGTGAVAILACPTHQDAIIGRFRAGVQTHHHLTTSLPSQ